MGVRLVVVEGPETGRVFSFDEADSFLIGRSPKGHLVLDPNADRYISRAHCLIDIRPPRIILNDLGSTNGTFVNEERIERSELEDGDEIRVGRTKIRVAASMSEGTTPAPEPATPLPNATASSHTAGTDSKKVAVAEHPSTDDEWPPPAVESDRAPPHASKERDVSARPPLCLSCAADLGDLADTDGLAAELTDAQYLCSACEQWPAETQSEIQSIGDYRILGELGHGGMGVVYKAVHGPTRRIVAIKQIQPRFDLEEREFRLFEREITVHSKVRHPNLARLLDHGRADGRPYLVVEYLAGGDTSDLVRDWFKGPVPVELAVRIGLDVLAGVETLHCGGVVHRDLKPQNILLSRGQDEGFGTAKITDYGLAKPFEDAGNSLFDLTRDDEAAGSLMFMPPEQILNYRHVRPPADIYAVGVSLYYLLTARFTVDTTAHHHPEAGTLPAGHTRNQIEALIEDDAIPILRRRHDLPEAIARVVDRAVMKELSQRYDTATVFRSELAAAAADTGLL